MSVCILISIIVAAQGPWAFADRISGEELSEGASRPPASNMTILAAKHQEVKPSARSVMLAGNRQEIQRREAFSAANERLLALQSSVSSEPVVDQAEQEEYVDESEYLCCSIQEKFLWCDADHGTNFFTPRNPNSDKGANHCCRDISGAEMCIPEEEVKVKFVDVKSPAAASVDSGSAAAGQLLGLNTPKGSLQGHCCMRLEETLFGHASCGATSTTVYIESGKYCCSPEACSNLQFRLSFSSQGAAAAEQKVLSQPTKQAATPLVSQVKGSTSSDPEYKDDWRVRPACCCDGTPKADTTCNAPCQKVCWTPALRRLQDVCTEASKPSVFGALSSKPSCWKQGLSEKDYQKQLAAERRYRAQHRGQASGNFQYRVSPPLPVVMVDMPARAHVPSFDDNDRRALDKRFNAALDHNRGRMMANWNQGIDENAPKLAEAARQEVLKDAIDPTSRRAREAGDKAAKEVHAAEMERKVHW